MLSVFHCDGDTIRHFWGSELFCAPADPGQEPRHFGSTSPRRDARDQLTGWRACPSGTRPRAIGMTTSGRCAHFGFPGRNSGWPVVR